MKLPINYDLENKIKTANGGSNIDKVVVEELQVGVINYVIIYLIYLAILRDPKPSWFIIDFAVCFFNFSNRVSKATKKEKKNIDEIKAKAYNDLLILSGKLKDSCITTNADLLKEAKVIKMEYKIIHEDGHLDIQQNKYFLVPTYNSLGDIVDISILQEHYFIEGGYILSLGSPSKKFVLAPSFR